MGLVFNDRVKEPASAAPGLGTISMSGTASPGCLTALAGIGTTNQSYFEAYDPTANVWEIFLGTVTAGSPVTISRDKTVNSSSGVGVAVNFGNTPQVWCDFPAYLAALTATSAAIHLASNAGAM